MTAFVFRPSRVKNGKRVYFRMYSGRYRRPGDVKRTTVALLTPDRQVAEAKLRELIRDMEKEEMGIAVPKRMRTAAETLLLDHIKAYCADLAAQGCSSEHVTIVKARQTKLTGDCEELRRSTTICQRCRVCSAGFSDWVLLSKIR